MVAFIVVAVVGLRVIADRFRIGRITFDEIVAFIVSFSLRVTGNRFRLCPSLSCTQPFYEIFFRPYVHVSHRTILVDEPWRTNRIHFQIRDTNAVRFEGDFMD